jgi:hypothetical protein
MDKYQYSPLPIHNGPFTIHHCPFTISPFSLFVLSFNYICFASTAGGLRNCNAADFASLKNLLRHFLIPINRDRTKRGGLCNYW